MSKKCLGCGIKLQYENEFESGYIPEKKYDNSSYCQRCFKLTHYGTLSKDLVTYTNETLINKINTSKEYTLFFIDYLNINKETINIYNKINTKKALIINKCDMLPEFLNKEKIVEFLKKEYEVKEDIILKGYKNREAKKILNYLNNNKIKKVYLVGLTNSGKSTLINDLIDLTNSNAKKVTVNKKTNTTLDILEVKINDNLIIVDTPGFILNNYITLPKEKNITSYIFQMKENETLNISDDYYINFNDNSNINYFTDIYSKRIEKNYSKNLEYQLELIVEENSDLIIYGLGFINFKQKTTIKTNLNRNNIEIRKSIFGGQDE